MSSTKKPRDPISNFSLSIFRLNAFLMRSGDRITKSIGQSSARWQVLGRLGHEPQTVAAVARSMGHARQSVQRIADLLVRDGLVKYETNPQDRRAQIMLLTPRGADVLTAIYDEYGKWQRRIVSKLDGEAIDTLANTLNKVADTLEADERRS